MSTFGMSNLMDLVANNQIRPRNSAVNDEDEDEDYRGSPVDVRPPDIARQPDTPTPPPTYMPDRSMRIEPSASTPQRGFAVTIGQGGQGVTFARRTPVAVQESPVDVGPRVLPSNFQLPPSPEEENEAARNPTADKPRGRLDRDSSPLQIGDEDRYKELLDQKDQGGPQISTTLAPRNAQN